MAEVWQSGNRPVRLQGIDPLVLLHTSSSVRAGCYGTGVGEAMSLCFSPDCPAPRSSGQSSLITSFSILASPSFGSGKVCLLHFSLALSPCIFMKFMDATLAPLQLQGIRVLNFTVDLRRLGLRLNIKSLNILGVCGIQPPCRHGCLLLKLFLF